ncbi:hypothetical protein AwDysgo_19460 [Bacteroidales bacterium]|nr:hypothetical protein AwDysgo_19460 [Bacteroidales bacterium]
MVSYTSAEKTNVRFISMWKVRKSTRKIPEILMVAFLPMEELNSQLIEICLNYVNTDVLDHKINQ